MYQYLSSKLGRRWANLLMIIWYSLLIIAILIGSEYEQGLFRYLEW